jgi:hypothetical protein
MVPLINRMEQRGTVIRKWYLRIVDHALASEPRRYAGTASRLDPHGESRSFPWLKWKQNAQNNSVTNDVSTFIHATSKRTGQLMQFLITMFETRRRALVTIRCGLHLCVCDT